MLLQTMPSFLVAKGTRVKLQPGDRDGGSVAGNFFPVFTQESRGLGAQLGVRGQAKCQVSILTPHGCSLPGFRPPGLNHPLPPSDPPIIQPPSYTSTPLPFHIPAHSLNPKLLSYSCHFRPLCQPLNYHHSLKSYFTRSCSKDSLLSCSLEGIILSSRLRKAISLYCPCVLLLSISKVRELTQVMKQFEVRSPDLLPMSSVMHRNSSQALEGTF